MYAPFDFRLVIDLPPKIQELRSFSSPPRVLQNPSKPQRPDCIEAAEVSNMDENDAISVVEALIETSKDGQKGYQDAAEHVKRSDLKTYFMQQSAERGRFAQELQVELAKLGKPEKKVSGSVAGAMHRAWLDTKANLGGGDKTILESVEAGEDRAKEAYQKAFGGNLPAGLSEIVRRQATSVQQAHDKVRMLRDQAKAA
jgi:uncharacterized protein (TIGR02284 family)